MGTMKDFTSAATPLEIATAIELEARRQGKSYGQFAYELERADYRVKRDIVTAYLAEKAAKAKKKAQRCKGCAYRVNGICTFGQTERLRRRDAEGKCLEYTAKGERRRISARRELHSRPGTVRYRLLREDWSEKTVPEIAGELGTTCKYVIDAMSDIKRATGQVVAYKSRRGGDAR